MVWVGRNALTLSPIQVGGPDLVPSRSGQVEGHSLLVWTQAQAIRHTFTRMRKLPRVRSIHSYIVDLSDVVAHHLNQEPVIADDQCRSDKNSQPILRADFLQIPSRQIVNPQMGWRFGVVFLERFASAVSPRFHAEEDQPLPTRKHGARLPRSLIGDGKIEILLPAPIDVDARRFAGGCEQQLQLRFPGANCSER